MIAASSESARGSTVKVIGVLNCTPDSFSDGSSAAAADTFISRGLELLDQGAAFVEVGGDSTRPGSVCPGIEEEWRRISPVLRALVARGSVAVDTHHHETARRAVEHGASMINDVSGSLDPEMLSVAVSSRVPLVCMFNPNRGAHRFDRELEPERAVQDVSAWMVEAQAVFTRLGGAPGHLVLDTGMGAFLGKDPSTSWTLIEKFHRLPFGPGGMMLGCSRKGFLKSPHESGPSDRDPATCLCGAVVAARWRSNAPLYLRVHDVKMQLEMLEISALLGLERGEATE